MVLIFMLVYGYLFRGVAKQGVQIQIPSLDWSLE